MARRSGMLAVLLAFSVIAPLAAFEPQSEAEQIERLARSVSQDVKQRREKIDREIEELQRLFDTKDPAQRQRAISKILSKRDLRFLPVITELLDDPNAYHRGQAIMTLFRLNARSAADKIGALVSSDPEASVRHQAAEYGTRLGYRSSMKEIKRFLADEDFTSQSVALHLSNSLPDDQEVELLAAFLDHKANHLRSRAVRRLMRHKPKLIKRHVMNVLGLAGDFDESVRRTVAREEKVLQKLATIDDLRKLSLQKTPFVKAMAYRMLRERGEDTTAQMLPLLSAKDPELRQEALIAFTAAGKGPEKEIVALLGDPNSRVGHYALEATRALQLRSGVPRLRRIFGSGERYDRKNAAKALLAMNESVWESRKLPTVEGPLFEAVAKLSKGDDAAAWATVINGADGIVNELAKLKAFPCKRDDMITGDRVKGLKVMRQGEGRISKRRCIGGNAPQRVQDAMIVHHGDLIVRGIMYDGIVVVTGNLYMHDGYVNDSIVIVQGDFVCGGYIKNSVVIAGRNKTLRLLDSHVGESVIAAGVIESGSSYTSESLYSGQMVNSGREVDIRNSRQFDAAPIYKRLGK